MPKNAAIMTGRFLMRLTLTDRLNLTEKGEFHLDMPIQKTDLSQNSDRR